MPNWIPVQAWYDTESGKYYMGAQPPMNPQPQQPQQQSQQIPQQSQGTVYIGQAGEKLRQQQQTLYSQPQQQRYYNPAGVPTQIVAGRGNQLVSYGQPPRQVNTAGQPYYETVIGSNGQPTTMRIGEYQQMRPVRYEQMINSQGQVVSVPIYDYSAYPGSGAPVRLGMSPDGQVYGGNTQTQVDGVTPTTPATPATTSTTTKGNTRTTTLSPEAPPSSSGAALGEQIVNDDLGVPTVPSYEPLPSATTTSTTTSTTNPVISNTREELAARLFPNREVDMARFNNWFDSLTPEDQEYYMNGGEIKVEPSGLLASIFNMLKSNVPNVSQYGDIHPVTTRGSGK